MKITIKSLHLENFKGCIKRSVDFGNKTKISGANATGKTTIFDAFTWLLFNKNSTGEEKFNVRPLDVNGNRIDNVEIKVVAVLGIDGKEVELSKVQKQKWVKKRGTDVAELQGNENLFEVDGYPKSEKDYKEYISSLVSEDLFKTLTSPTYFASLPWKDQRNILMNFVSGISDLEIVQGNPKYADLVSEIEKAPSLDDIKAKYQKALSEWKKRQAELPVRIDEASKMKCEVDTAELELAKKDLERRICEISAKITDKSSILSDLQSKDLKMQFEVNGLYSKANDALMHERRQLGDCIFEKNVQIENIKRSVEQDNKLIEQNEYDIKSAQKCIEELAEEWKQVKGKIFDRSVWVFDESSTVCSLCGQLLPNDKTETLKAEFESRVKSAEQKFDEEKASQLEEITDAGKRQRKSIDDMTVEVSELKVLVEANKKELEDVEKTKAELQTKLSALPIKPDMSHNLEYKKVLAEHESIKRQIVELPTVDNSELEQEKSDLQSELDSVKDRISQAQKNIDIDNRIAELEEEQKEIGQKVADQEKMLYLLEEFIREKMNVISSSINEKFKTVEWKLFEMQLNGGMKECCECTVNGVPYSTLNSGHRIVAGLDIIRGLSELKGVVAPIFIDNAEAINDFNIPQMDAQMILLSVSEDVEMVVM